MPTLELDFLPHLQSHEASTLAPDTRNRTVEVILLPHSSAKAELWDAVVHVSSDGISTSEELDLSEHFPNGSFSVLFATVPNTNYPLPINYRIYVDNFTREVPVNTSVAAAFNSFWVGNVVIAKYARGNSYIDEAFANMHRQEVDLLLTLVGIWLRQQWDGISS
ncbi:hypothetical protein MD484_g281, partial [Candolleomyces efflorescens]